MPFFVTDQREPQILNFKPLRPAIKVAAFYWQGFLLNADAPADAPEVDLTHSPLDEILFDLFGELSLMELYFLHRACQKQGLLTPHIDWSVFFRKQNRFWNDKVALLFKQLEKCPEAFLDWCADRKIENKDLYPLLSLKEDSQWTQFNLAGPFWSKQNLSRNDGKRALDLVIDLILMNAPSEKVLPNGKSTWLNQLNLLRNPLTTQKDETNTTSAWPQYVKLKKQRQGDRLLQQLEISFLNNEDLKQKLNRLAEKVQQI